ncbi:MAG: glycosyltransferase family 9 protein [Planctomycetota bacterium]
MTDPRRRCFRVRKPIRHLAHRSKPPPATPMNLFFHQATLSEFALCFPILRCLEPPITVVAPWSRAELAVRLLPGCQPLDIELFEFTRLHTPKGPSALSPAIAELFEQATRIISFIGTGDSPWPDHMRRVAPQAELFIVDPRPEPEANTHLTNHYRAQLERQGLGLPAPEAQSPARHDGPVVIHPGSGAPAKCWPRPHYEALIQHLVEAGHSVRPVIGEVEAKRWDPDTLDHWATRLNAVLCRSPVELLDTSADARLFIGNDAGPAHTAALAAIPTLTLFGPTRPSRTGPLGPAAHHLAPPDPQPMDWLTVEHTLQIALELLA